MGSAVGSFVTLITVVGDTADAQPQILSTAPVGGAVVGVNTFIAVVFSKAINTSTVTGSSFQLREPGGLELLPPIPSPTIATGRS